MRLYTRDVRAVLIALTVICCGSANASMRDDAPPRGDPFIGIIDRTKLKAAAKPSIDGIGDKRLAVILSDNTEKHLKWSQEATTGETGFNRAMASLFGKVSESDRVHKELFAPETVVNAVVEPLVRKAKAVSVVQEISEFRKGNFDVLVVMDVTFVNIRVDTIIGFGGKYESGTYINAYFIDRTDAMMGQVEVGQTKEVNPARFVEDAAAIRREMVSRYQASVDRLLGQDRAEATAPPAALSAKRPVGDRLKELDDLVKQGLIKPEEADARRKKILDDI